MPFMTLPVSTKLAEPRVGYRELFAYALGAVPDMIGFHGPMQLINPVFHLALGLNPTWIGIAKGVGRLWDAFTDPWMGAISDRGMGSRGRRSPYILIGTLSMAVVFFLMWNVPRGLSDVGYFVFMIGAVILFDLAFTIFTVPYHGLGYELAETYHERTRVMSWRLAFNMAGNAVVGWLFAATQLPFFADTLEGVYYVGAATGLVIVICGITTGLFVRERPRVRVVQRITVWASIRAAWRNGPFMKLVFVALAFLISVTIAGTTGLYVTIYYVFGGKLSEASVLLGISGTIGSALTLGTAYLWSAMSRRMSKRGVLLVALGGYAVLIFGSWWIFTPQWPYLQLLHGTLSMALIYGFFVMLQSMIADACDYDEFVTGARREAMFGAILTWFQKVGVSIAFVIVGAMIEFTGLDITPGAKQSPDAIMTLRTLFALVPTTIAVLAAGIIWRYPLDAEFVARIGTELRQRRAASVA